MKFKLFLLSGFLFVFIGCKDADRAQLRSMGSRHRITQYGCDGKVLNQWESTGNVSNESQSDGWYFEDEKTHRLIEVTGTLLIEQE